MTVPSSVLLAGGGSAGHVSPLLSVADALRRRCLYQYIDYPAFAKELAIVELRVPQASGDLLAVSLVSVQQLDHPGGLTQRGCRLEGRGVLERIDQPDPLAVAHGVRGAGHGVGLVPGDPDRMMLQCGGHGGG